MENNSKKELRFLRNDRLNVVSQRDSQKRKEEAAKKRIVIEKIFISGTNWFKNGKKIEDATDIITFDGKEMMLKDNIYFLRGYEAGMFQLGFECGYKQVSLDTINDSFKSNKHFMDEYNKGIKQREIDERKKNGASKK